MNDNSIRARDVRLIAFYLPQFHPTAENDRWWGKGFTEWRNVAGATPLFDGHYQPRLPGDLGFYDLRLDETRYAQIQLARDAGLHGFCFYYYWFNGRRILERPLDAYVSDTDIDFPFCICWANENWSRLWDGGNRELLLVQEHDLESDMQFLRDIIPLLRDPRYIRVDGKPLVVLYRVDLLKNPQATVAGWLKIGEEAGLPGLYLCCVQSFKPTDPYEYGFDAACEFPPHQYKCGAMTNEVEGLEQDFKGTIYSYDVVSRESLTKVAPHYPLLRGIFPSWDNSPRKRQHALVFHNSEPTSYEYWLRGLIEYSRQNLETDERIIFINAWNEWAEGAYLEPDLRHGLEYIEATARASSGRTKPSVLLELLESCVDRIEPNLLREEFRAYLGEIGTEVRELSKTIDYFQREKVMVQRFQEERAAAAFHRIDPHDILGPEPLIDLEFWLELFNGNRPQKDVMVSGRVSLHIQGWALSPSVIPDASTTARYLLLRETSIGETYAAQIHGYVERNDVANEKRSVDRKYTLMSGFRLLFSLSNVPKGIYEFGFGLKGDYKAAWAWSKQSIRVLS
jgi:hypothetical protein